MESKILSDERINFSDRLKGALALNGMPTSTAAFVREYNLRADGATVTSHAARKWLNGDAIPTQEKIVVLANWLGVHASWLRFGDSENGKTYVGAGDPNIPAPHLTLLRDIAALPIPAQQVVRDLVDALLRAYAAAVPKSDEPVSHHLRTATASKG